MRLILLLNPTKNMKDLYKLLIEKGLQTPYSNILWNFAYHTFTQPHTKDMVDLYKYVVQNSIELKDASKH
ncbi:MAG: hypothetical protein U0T83_08550 [Bacteriovoracaceae bacterium]